MTDGNASRRRFIRGFGAAGVVAVAGCTSGGSDETSTRTTTATTTEEATSTTTEQTTTTTDEATVEDVRERRAALTDEEKALHYQSGIPSINDYSLDFDRVQEENDTRRDQLIDVTATVGDQYDDWVDGNHAVMNAIHNLDWMGWNQENIVNIVTRYNSQPMEQVTANYSTEDGGRNLDGTIARDSASGPQKYIEDIPDSELMDGDVGNFLTTDMENLRKLVDEGEMTPNGWETTQITMQSIVPGIKGPSEHDNRSLEDADRNLLFDGDALTYIGEHYRDSAEAVNEVSGEALEIGMSTVPIRTSGRYVGVTAEEDGLEVDAVYSQEEAEEKLREPVEL